MSYIHICSQEAPLRPAYEGDEGSPFVPDPEDGPGPGDVRDDLLGIIELTGSSLGAAGTLLDDFVLENPPLLSDAHEHEHEHNFGAIHMDTTFAPAHTHTHDDLLDHRHGHEALAP